MFDTIALAGKSTVVQIKATQQSTVSPLGRDSVTLKNVVISVEYS